MIVLPGTKDTVSKSGRARGNVIYIHNGRSTTLATVYGANLIEMRRNKWAVTDLLKDAYEERWYDRIKLTDCMRAAISILRVLGPRRFALVVGKSTVRALFKRGIIDGDLRLYVNGPRQNAYSADGGKV